MNNIKLLIKNYFNSFIGGFAKNKKIGKYLNAILFIGIVSILLLVFFCYSAYTMTKEFINLDNVNYSYAGYAIYSACSNLIMMTILFIILRSTAPSKSNDAELLLSMPIKRNEIIIAKSITNYFFDLITLMGFSFPNFLIYFLMVKTAKFSMVIRSLIIIIILPLFINGMANIIGNLINKLTKKLKLVSLIQTILLLALIALFLFYNFSLNDILTNNLDLSLDEILDKVFIIKLFYKFIMNNNLLYFLIIISLSLIIYFLGIIIRKNELGKETYFKKNDSKIIKYQSNSPFKAILKKEANRFFTNPMYIMNTSFGVILVIGASIYVMITGRALVDSMVEKILKISSTNSPYIVLMLAASFISTVCTTYCSISLEGKTFWILKSIPLKETTILYAKIIFNVILAGTSGIIASIMICFVFGFKYLLMYISFILLLVILISSIGMYLNLLYPKMEWDSDIVPIKQSMSVLIAMSIGFVIPIILMIIYIILQPYLNSNVIIIIFNLILISLNFILYKLINTKGIKLFNTIN